MKQIVFIAIVMLAGLAVILDSGKPRSGRLRR